MSHRVGSIGIASRQAEALCLLVAVVLAVGLAACDEDAAIRLRPVELVDPAPEDPFELDPLLASKSDRSAVARAGGSTEAARAAGVDRERTVELAGGDVVTIRMDDSPALVLAGEDVAFVELAESAVGEASVDGAEVGAASGEPGERFAVFAVLGEAGRAAWGPFAAEHANDYLLVEIAGRPVDLIRPLGWTRGLRIGVFADELARTRFIESLPFDPR